jgi:hypothetical protein
MRVNDVAGVYASLVGCGCTYFVLRGMLTILAIFCMSGGSFAADVRIVSKAYPAKLSAAAGACRIC